MKKNLKAAERTEGNVLRLPGTKVRLPGYSWSPFNWRFDPQLPYREPAANTRPGPQGIVRD